MKLTNRQLMYIISIALVVTLFGTAINLSRLGAEPGLTGAVVGNASVTINKQAAFNISTNISWGLGAVDSGQTAATLDTEGTPYVSNGNWSTTNADGFILENTGNVDLNLTVTSTYYNYTAATFLGGTSPAYKYSMNELEGSACSGAGGSPASEANVGFDENATQVCGNFSWLDSTDLLSLDINMTIPYDSLLGYREDVWTISAAERT